MAKQKTKRKNRPIGKKPVEKKHLIDPRYKNTFWTVVFIIVLVIFFIVNNTRSVPDRGPYPPNYSTSKVPIQNTMIDSRINFITPNKTVNDTNK
jgi:hypothetical protein